MGGGKSDVCREMGEGEKPVGQGLVVEHNLTNFKRKCNKNQRRDNVHRQEHSWLGIFSF